MKTYLSYQESVKELATKKAAGFSADVIEAWLKERFAVGGFFTIIKNGQALIQKESLLFQFQKLIDSSKTFEYEELSTSHHEYLVPYHLAELKLKRFSSGDSRYLKQFAAPILEDVVLSYHLNLRGLEKALARPGIYPLLNGVCGFIDCCGLDIEVKQIDNRLIVWTAAYYQQKYPRPYLIGQLLFEKDFIDFHPLGAREDRVLIPLPIIFAKKDLKDALSVFKA